MPVIRVSELEDNNLNVSSDSSDENSDDASTVEREVGSLIEREEGLQGSLINSILV